MAAEIGNPENSNYVEESTPLQPQDQNLQPKEDIVQQTFSQKLIFVFRNITVEPSLLLFIVGIMMSSSASSNLNLEKACRVNLEFPSDICDALRTQEMESQNQYERETQQLLTSAMAWKTYLSATIPSVIALFAGVFSDKTGYRKMFMAISIFGQIIAGINYIINVIFFYQLPLQVLVFTDALIEGLSGGLCLCFLAGFSIISSITTKENRTFRLGLVNFHVTVAFPIGIGMSGPLLRAVGYYGVYGITTGLHVLNFLYIIFVLKDPPRTNEQKEHDGKGIVYFIRTFFDFVNVKNTLKVLFRKAPNNRRIRIVIYLVIGCLVFGPVYGEATILYLSTRYRFNWDEINYSMYQTYNFIVHTIGTVFSILVFSKYLQWHDAVLGIISSVSKILASFVYAFAPNAQIFYIGPAVEILSGTATLAMRSIFSKLVDQNELGSMLSVVGLTENLMPLVYVPLYTQVYSATMETFPGAVFLISTVLTIPVLIVMMGLFYEHRRNLRKPKAQNGMGLQDLN